MKTHLFNENPLVVNPSLAAAIGLSESIVIQQMQYWLKKSTNKIKGQSWIYNTYDEWALQFPFWKPETIRKIFSKLRKMGLIKSEKLSKNKWDKTNWYTINYQILDETLARFDAENHTASIGKNAPHDDAENHTASIGKNAPHDITETTQRLTTETTTENASKNKRAASPSSGLSKSDSDHNKVFEHWQSVHGKQQAKLIKNRLSKINARFKEGYTVDQLKLAIDGCKLSGFHMGENDKGTPYNDLTTILRDGAQVEKFIGLAENPQKQQVRTGYLGNEQLDYSKGVKPDGTF
jgi:hypothetical protein